MPYLLKEHDGLVEVLFSGLITPDELMKAGQDFQALEARLEISPHRLTDLTEAGEINVDFSQMERFAAVRRSAQLKNKVKSAIIAPSPVQFGLARMFQTLNTNPMIHIRIFKDPSSARRWLAEEMTE